MIRAVLLAFLLAVSGGVPARAEIHVVPVTSPGGIEAWLYEDHSLPILTIGASFLGGAVLDPEGKRGTANLMADLLDEGAGTLDSAAFATALEDIGAQIGFSASDDAVNLGAGMLTESRDATLDLLRLALTEPRFDREPLERIRAQILGGIRQSDADPQARAYHTFYEEAFPDHPYGLPSEGTAASVATITADDLRAARAALLTRAHLEVAVVGDITPQALGPVLDRVFGDLPAAGPDLPAVTEPRMTGETTVIDFDTPQSVVFFGNAGIATDDPDRVPAMIVDYVLGGGMSARLSREIRVERGLTYGASTWLASGRFGSLYMGTFSSSNDQVGEAVGLLRDQWARMAADGPTDAELDGAKRYLTGAFPLRFNGSANIASELLALQVGGLDVGYVNRRSDLIEAVTASDAARVARRLVVPEDLTLVIAGRPKGIASGR